MAVHSPMLRAMLSSEMAEVAKQEIRLSPKLKYWRSARSVRITQEERTAQNLQMRSGT